MGEKERNMRKEERKREREKKRERERKREREGKRERERGGKRINFISLIRTLVKPSNKQKRWVKMRNYMREEDINKINLA